MGILSIYRHPENITVSGSSLEETTPRRGSFSWFFVQLPPANFTFSPLPTYVSYSWGDGRIISFARSESLSFFGGSLMEDPFGIVF